MRSTTWTLPLILLASAACDNKQATPEAPDAAAQPISSAAASAPAADSAGVPDATSPDAASAADAGGVDAGAVTMPERPLPRGQTMVSSGAPIEVQQKAIAYMVAMRAPRANDAPADPAYAGELAEKLKPIILSMDTGADKAKLNRVEVVASGRQLDLLMAGGCDDKTPTRAVASRAGASLPTLLAHGVLVVRCNDARTQCLQSTRDPSDVLCTTAPRHK